MSLSAIDKIDKAAKSAYKTSLSDSLYGYNYGGYIPSGDLSRDEYGAAAAYAVIVEIFAAIAVWETYLDGVTWIVRDKSTGKEIGRTDVRDYPLNERGGKWIASIRRFEMNYHHSFWKSLAFSDWLYGNSYVVMLPAERQLHPNRQLWAGLKWLNPLNTTTQVMNGKIAYYSYSGMDNEDLDSFHIPPEQMAYRINRRNAFDDNLGYSGVLAAMDAINLSRNAVRAFKNFFSNGMQLGGVISPTDNNVWSPTELENARREWRENHKGTTNAGKWAVIPRRAEITPFGQEDASSNFTVTKDLRNTIYAALSVFPQLAGDPSDATYDNAKEVKRQWWQMLANPYAKDIAGYQTNVVIPKLEPDANVYIEPDLSPYEVEEPEIISQDVNAGIIDIATGQTKRGYPVDNELRGIYMIAGRPMSKDILLQVANSLPATEVQQYAQADKYQAESEQIASTPVTPTESPVIEAPITSDEMASLNTPTEDTSVKSQIKVNNQSAFAYIPLPNQSDVLAVQRELRKLLTDTRIEWQLPPTFHVTMCYADVVTDEAISKIVSLINPERMELQPVQGNGIDSFDTPEGKALHIRLFRNSVIDAIQADIYSAFGTEAYDISEFSKPDAWNPHITLAYIPNDIRVDTASLNSVLDWLDSVVIRSDEIIIGRDDYDPVVVLTAPEYKSHYHDHTHNLPPLIEVDTVSELEELSSWRKFISNGKAHKRAFEQKALRGDIGDMLQAAIDSKDKQTELDAFKAAQTRIETRIKAIQNTRLDFENDFDTLLSRARAEKMGRQQWASAMRSIIRRFGTRAYIDGMADGGVEDDPSEDDKIEINGLIGESSKYVTELGNVLYRGDGISDASADTKATMWSNKTLIPFYQAGLISADGNSLYEWVYGETEHCSDCLRLNGQRHRLKGWKANYLPQGDNLECNGFNCKCVLTKVRGRQRGNY